MKSFILGLAALTVAIQALSLSYKWKAHEARACFYVNAPDPNVHINIYFSATNSKSFDDTKAAVIATVSGPKNQQLYSTANDKRDPNEDGSKSHAEFTVKAIEAGDHAICFTHSSSPTEKNLDLDVSLTNPDGTPFTMARPEDEGKVLTQATADAATHELEESINKLIKDLTEMSHTHKYYRNRAKRNMDTVNSINRTIFWFSFGETILFVGMSLCQVVVYHMFFGRSGRPRV